MTKEALIHDLNKTIRSALSNYYLPGLAIGYKQEGQESVIMAEGYSSFPMKTPLTKDSIFHMASISKLFTACGIMILFSEKDISQDTCVVELLPDFKMLRSKNLSCDYPHITVRKILSHTSGLPDVTDYRWDLKNISESALEDYCKSDDVSKRTLLWSCDENKFSYSNIGYELLGLIIQKVSNLSFEDYMDSIFFKPLNMRDSTFKTYERTKNSSLSIEDLLSARVVAPHGKDHNNNIIYEKHFPYNRGHGPSSTLTSTLSDILIWSQSLLKKDPIFQRVYSFSPFLPVADVSNSDEKIGLSFFIWKDKGKTYIGHEGSDDGFRSSLWMCPDTKISVIVCSNLTKAPVKKINREIFTIIHNHLTP